LLLYYSSLAPGHRNSPANNILVELEAGLRRPGDTRFGPGQQSLDMGTAAQCRDPPTAKTNTSTNNATSRSRDC